MAAKSRTEYSARNTTVAMISRISAIIMGFALRVVFTRTLSESYVGLNGLFLEIISVLSLSEMGVGTAITFALYKPIAEGNIEKQKSLMRMYCWFYRIVALVVLGAGLCIIPFLSILIKDYASVDQVIVIYLLYLVNAVCSYLFIYKRTLMDAHQLQYIGTFYMTMSWVLQDILQIGILIFTKNFVLFLLVNILTTIICNVCTTRRANKLYPYLADKQIEPLEAQERKSIFRNIKAMLMHKVGDVVVCSTDNMILSAFVGLTSVGCYSNYYLVIGSISQLLDQMFAGITASVGNLGVTAERTRVRKVFEASFFAGYWLYGLSAICLYELINPFVELSFGRQYLFAGEIVLILCVNFYVKGMRRATLIFRDSLGLFWYDRYKAIVEAVLNLVISIVLVQYMGTIGVFLGTLISTSLTSVWVEPYILYKHEMKSSVLPYFGKYICYTFVLAIGWLATDWLCNQIAGGLGTILILRLAVCVTIPNLLFLLVYARTGEFRFLWEKLKMLLQRKRGHESCKKKE